MSSVIDNAAWQNIPHEIWLTIFAQLPVKSRVSLACTCKKLYEFSLDRLLGNVNQRAELYLKIKKPLPPLLARSIRILRVGHDWSYEGKWRYYKDFLREQILRMTNLQKLIIGDDYPVYGREKFEEIFSMEEMCSFFACENLEYFRVPVSSLTQKASLGRNLLHYAVETGRIKLVESFLSQFETYFFNNRDKLRALTVPPGLSVKDKNGSTPLMLALQCGNREMVSLLLRREGRGASYQLRDGDFDQQSSKKKSKVKEDISLLVGETMSYGAHLQVEALRPENDVAFFTALAENRTIISLDFGEVFWEERGENPEQRTLFLHKLAEALQKNTQILLLDLRNCFGLTSEESKFFFQCLRLEELLLPVSLLNAVDDAKQTLLHSAVLAHNKKIAASLVAQEVSLSPVDDKGYTSTQLARALGANEMAAFLEDAAKQKIAKIALGKKVWEKYCGKVDKEPPLPPNILEILESPCPIWPDQKILDTHFLAFIPKTINRVSYQRGWLKKVIEHPKEEGYATSVNAGYEMPTGFSQWVLFTKELIPNTEGENEEVRHRVLRDLAAKIPPIPGLGDYRIPKKLEAATCILLEYVRSGRRYYAHTLSYCQEMGVFRQDGLGAFGPSRINLGNASFLSKCQGNAMLREVLV